ncbi:25S rRNA (adenine645-N1)-methyltransferase [Coccidioides immitis]|nr:25S rRNA (adenine645-N1)-methyltransferase [Coccidioides immitis]
MFAVPGWSVSVAELKPQTEQEAPASHTPAADNGPDNTSRSKKRKRKHGTEDKVTKANVDEMWRRYIEGQDTKGRSAVGPKSRKQKKKEKKLENTKRDTENYTAQADAPSTERRDGKSKSTRLNDPIGRNGDEIADEVSEVPRKKRKQTERVENSMNAKNKPSTSVASLPPSTSESNLTPLQKAMRDKLVSARFRHLNETLYTTPSTQALELFTANPELFSEYHAGFSRQVKESWPSNPVDDYILSVRTRGPVRPPSKGHKKPERPGGPTPLPRRPNGLCTIADLGCGDAQFSRALAPVSKKMKMKILSYDLHEGDPLITKADISSLPLEDGTVDVTIFCLSLMGTNWVSFVEEAWRVLRGDGKGECWVSEVKSRFGKVTKKSKQASKPPAWSKNKTKKKRKETDDDEDDVGDEIFAEDVRANPNDDDETDISAFVEVFRTRGFILKPQSVDKSNKMFIKMEFVKHGVPTKGKWASAGVAAKAAKKRFLGPEDSTITPEEEAKVLKPCVYKIR